VFGLCSCSHDDDDNDDDDDDDDNYNDYDYEYNNNNNNIANIRNDMLDTIILGRKEYIIESLLYISLCSFSRLQVKNHSGLSRSLMAC